MSLIICNSLAIIFVVFMIVCALIPSWQEMIGFFFFLLMMELLIGHFFICFIATGKNISEPYNGPFSVFKEKDKVHIVIKNELFTYTDASVVNHIDEVDVEIKSRYFQNAYNSKTPNGYEINFVPKTNGEEK